jgi:hypothetical protein
MKNSPMKPSVPHKAKMPKEYERDKQNPIPEKRVSNPKPMKGKRGV